MGAKRDIGYTELAKAKVQDTRNIVISRAQNATSEFTIAQQVIVNEGGRQTSLFLKSAFHVDDINGLVNLRDAINVAIAKVREDDEVAPDNDGYAWGQEAEWQ